MMAGAVIFLLGDERPAMELIIRSLVGFIQKMRRLGDGEMGGEEKSSRARRVLRGAKRCGNLRVKETG